MLVVRRAQLDAFTQPFWDAFAPKMVEHLRLYFPVDAALLGDVGLGRVVWAGIARVRAHRIDLEGDACRYISLSMALGSAFDTDPLLPWASEILGFEMSGSARVAKLRARALDHLNRVAGPNGGEALKAVLRTRNLDYRELCEPWSASDEGVRERLCSIYPTRCVELESAASWSVFFAQRDRVAAEARLSTPGSRAICAIYMCLLGSHFPTDPLHPWLRRGLGAARQSDADAAGELLLEDGKAWVTRALPLMSRGAS